ncbi:alpha/beta-hydrolase [Meira miltonrushii]|uniref:Prolyl endopeptidase n=1 Tax=Meira miltonrushii TaxID=1280837 RepID=A0A316V6P9_9BASI|nr:alpha/beta-hydrolase [Meira miltonrushii]PWN33210.1 alpha/beta-hydrolase [Meira miltonrushii]
MGGKPFYLYGYRSIGDQPPLWYTVTVAEFQSAKKTNFATPLGRLFLNESLLSSDDSVSIVYTSVSPNGKTFAYQVSQGGDGDTWYFRSFDILLTRAKTTPRGGEGRLKDFIPLLAQDMIYWTPDSKSFFYSSIADSNGGTNPKHSYKVRHHILGTDSKQDVTVFDSKNAGEFGEDYGRWLIVAGYHDAAALNTIAYASLLTGQKISNNMKWISLAPDFNFTVLAGGVVNDSYYFWTSKDATNGKVAKFNLDWSKARQVKSFTELQDRPPVIDVIPERKDALINTLDVHITAKDKLLVNYIEEGKMALYLHETKDGKLIKRLLPNESFYVDLIVGDPDSNTIIVLAESWTTPRKVFEFKWDGSTMESSTLITGIIKNSNPDDFVTEKRHAASKDGTQITYFVVHRKGIQMPAPAFLHAYAAYGYIDSFYYQPNYFDFFRSYDGIFVYVGARGGGDNGGSWHDDGSGLNKEKTFEDIIAVMQDLVAIKYAIAGKFVIEGGSAGGLAMAAVANQAPAGLVGLALPVRAPCDVFQLELRTTVGLANRPEFGDVTTPEGFDAVRAWSPLQNVVPNKSYPAIFLTPGSYDETVPPSSSYKLLAELQHTNPNNALPFLMYVVHNKGHVPSTILESSYQFCIMEEALHITRRKG